MNGVSIATHYLPTRSVNMKRRFLLSAGICQVFFLIALAGYADGKGQSAYASVYISPVLSFPISADSVSYYGFVGGGTASLELPLPFLPALYVGGEIGYAYYSLRNAVTADQSLSMLSAAVGMGLQFGLAPWMNAKLYANAGYSYGFFTASVNPTSGGGTLVEGGAGLVFYFPPSFSLELRGGYRYEFGIFQGVVASLGLGFQLGTGGGGRTPEMQRPQLLEGPGLSMDNVQFSNIFPVFHKYYDDHPVGTAVLTNNGDKTATDIKVSLEIKPYMTAAKQCKVQSELAPTEFAAVDLYALFSEDTILAVTEGTKASATISWEYTVEGQRRTGQTVETVRILNRNAMTWDDDRRAAAFVTSLDPAVLAFSKNACGMVKTVAGGAIDPHMQQAIVLYEALCQYGMSYVVDPKSAYVDFSQSSSDVDFLQFPQQTLEYKGGDCDDLSILYCALFESVGIDTAFITVPGHIFMAFALGTKPADASFQSPDDLLINEDKVWIPIEVTSLDGKFLEAWQLGAKEWREGEAAGTAAFYPLHEAWQEYEPVGLVGGNFRATLPAAQAVVAAYQRETERFAQHEIYPEISQLQAEIKKNQNNAASMNKLGVLYAKYNMLDQAEAQFRSIVAKQEYVPALVNLGNIAFMRKDMKTAAAFYERALKGAPDDPKVIVCLARAYNELENYGLVADLYTKLQSLDPDLATQFSYLSMKGQDSTKAADVSEVREVILWGEE